MKWLDKFKSVLFEDEEQEDVKVEERKETPVEAPKVVEQKAPVQQPVPKAVPKESSPFQQFDEEEFDRLAEFNKSRLEARDKEARAAKEREERAKQHHEARYDYDLERRTIEQNNLQRRIIEEKDHVEKRFKPSPVISPVYGILDKNYKKEDLVKDKDQAREIDVDQVRKKAFGTLEHDMPAPKEEVKLASDNEEIIKDDGLSEVIARSEVKITSFEDDVTEDANKIIENDNTNEESTIDEIEKILPSQENEKELQEDRKDEDNIENDLYNLIDSMYHDKEDGE